MANCRYTLTLWGKSMDFGSYDELFQVLINNRHKIELGNLTDIVFSLNPQSEIEAKITKIKQTNKSISLEEVGISKITDDPIYKGNENYITLSDLLLNPENELNNPFNIENYKVMEVAKLVESGMSNIEATAEVERRLAHFEDVALKAQQVKSVVALYFSGLTNAKAIMDKVEESNHFGWDFNVYSELVSQLDRVRARIESQHGSGSSFIPSVTLTSDLNGSTDKLIGKVDLIVVDNKGVPHIYTFRTSEKSSAEWEAVKEQDIDYKMGFYRHMLAANGISVKDSELYVVPINIDIEEGNLVGANIETPQDRLTPGKSGLNRLTWGSGSFYNNIDRFIPITITDDLVISDIREKVMKYLYEGLGTKSLQNTRAISSVDSFIAKVKESDDYSKGKWMFFDNSGTTTKKVYIKETSPKASNAELREKVTQYLERESKKYEAAGDKLIKDLSRAIKGDLDFGEILPDSNNPSYLSQLFSKYTGDNWDVINIPKLRDLGILGIVNNTTKQIDFFSLSYHFGLNTVFSKFGMGTTLLGKFESDRTALTKPNVMKATNGNIELMKILFAINEIPELFNGVFKVGSVRALNPLEGSASVASQNELWTTFNELCNHLKLKNNLSETIEFANQFDILAQDFLGVYPELKNSSTFKNIKGSLLLSPTDVANKLKIVNDIISSLERNYHSITSNVLDHKESPIANLYVNAWTTKMYLEGNPFYQTHVLEKFNIVSGTKTTAPSLVGDANLKTMNSWIQNSMGKITGLYNKFLDKFQYEYIRNGLWKDKGYSQADENLLGSQNRLYANMFVVDPESGKPNSNLIVKNPWTDTSLSAVEKKVLKRMLFEWNKWRYPVELKGIDSENSASLQRILESKERSFWVPVFRASSASRLSQKGVMDMLKQQYKDIKDAGSYFRREHENIDTDTEEIKQVVNRIRNNREELFKFFNPIEFSEKDAGKRAEYIASQDFDYWSRNLEDVTLSFEIVNLQKQEYNTLLPKIKALKMAALLYGQETGIAMDSFVEYVEDQTKISIHNQTILNEEAQKAAGMLSLTKYVASAAVLGFNPRGLFREHIEGAWKMLVEGLSKKYGEDAFTMSDIKFAEKYIYGDIASQVSEVTKAEKLNQMFRLANLDLNALAERTRTNKGGLLNFTDRWMFWSNTAPDFRKRLVLLIAQIKHDGIWDAISMKNDALYYDWKKDKRFNVLATGNTANPEYAKQKGLYLQLMNDINQEEGTNLKFGDDLPRMYTRAEMNALKNYSDRVFGSYDHETKVQVERTFMGMLFMQFQTYLTATKATWLTKPGLYNLGKRVQAVDDKTRQLLWLKEGTNEEGESVWIPTTENTGIPLYANTDSYYEGIVYSIKGLYDAYKEGGVSALKTSLLSDPIKRANLTHAGLSLFISLVVMGISKYLIDLLKEMWKEEKLGTMPNYNDAFIESAGEFLSKAYLGSTGDLDLFGTVYNTVSNVEPASIGVFSKFIDSTNSTIFGDMKLSTYLKSNVGAIRSTSSFWDNFSDVYHFGEVKVKEISE